jgi:predicted acetyltransferase
MRLDLDANEEHLLLVAPTVTLKSSYLGMLAELAAEGGTRAEQRARTLEAAQRDFEGYVQQMKDASEGRNLRPGLVPQTTFWLVRDGIAVVGETGLRHRLTPQLEREGGHIGYFIRPSERRKGYGTAALALTLQEARKLGIEKVLVTCDPDNIASARVIEKNGGKLDPRPMPDGPAKLRYWIDLDR